MIFSYNEIDKQFFYGKCDLYLDFPHAYMIEQACITTVTRYSAVRTISISPCNTHIKYTSSLDIRYGKAADLQNDWSLDWNLNGANKELTPIVLPGFFCWKQMIISFIETSKWIENYITDLKPIIFAVHRKWAETLRVDENTYRLDEVFRQLLGLLQAHQCVMSVKNITIIVITGCTHG